MKFKKDWYDVAHFLKCEVGTALQAVLEYGNLDIYWDEASDDEKREVYLAVSNVIQDYRIKVELVEWVANVCMVDISEEQDGSQYQFMMCSTFDFANELLKYEKDKKEALNDVV